MISVRWNARAFGLLIECIANPVDYLRIYCQVIQTVLAGLLVEYLANTPGNNVCLTQAFCSIQKPNARRFHGTDLSMLRYRNVDAAMLRYRSMMLRYAISQHDAAIFQTLKHELQHINRSLIY